MAWCHDITRSCFQSIDKEQFSKPFACALLIWQRLYYIKHRQQRLVLTARVPRVGGNIAWREFDKLFLLFSGSLHMSLSCSVSLIVSLVPIKRGRKDGSDIDASWAYIVCDCLFLCSPRGVFWEKCTNYNKLNNIK